MLFFFTGTPGPPYNLTIADVSKTHADLKWDAPKNDGGRPILRWLHMAIVAVDWWSGVLGSVILLLFMYCYIIY